MLSSEIIKEIRFFIDAISLKSLYTGIQYNIPKKVWPSEWDSDLQLAEDFKKNGRYEDSINKYLALIYNSNTAYLTFIYEIYKNLLCSGYTLEAIYLLLSGARVSEVNSPNRYFEKLGVRGEPNNFMVFFRTLLDSAETENYFKSYLTEISGNPNYIYPLNGYFNINNALLIISVFKSRYGSSLDNYFFDLDFDKFYSSVSFIYY
jgi:hypothetical protein